VIAPGGATQGRATALLAAMAAAFFLLLLLPSLSPYYGFYSDELYYLVCAKRLDLGYVDQPPLFPLVLRLHAGLFGDSLVALRVLPAATGAVTAFLAGWMARRMGGGLFAQVLATLAVIVSPTSLSIFNFFTVNCLSILLWTVASWVLLERCRSEEPRLWLVLGGVLGLAFLTKHTAVVPIAGVALATLLSPLRRDLRGVWPWLGALAFMVIVSPNLWWQAVHDWPSLAFYTSVEKYRYSASALEQIVGQVVYQNPVASPIWAAGVYFFLRSSRGRRYRPLGWLFLAALVLAIIGGSKLPSRIAGVFPVVFAGGAVLLEATRKAGLGRLRRIWNTYTLPSLMLLVGLAVASLVLPVLPPPLLARHPLYDADEGAGFRPEIGTNEIPYHLGNRTHWQAFVATVVEVVRDLDPAQRDGAIILADYFGHAGALEYYGRGQALPPVYSPMTGYFLWGPPDGAPETVISIGIDEDFLRARFERVTVAATFRCTYCPPVVNDLPIHVARGPERPFSELWPEIGRLEDRRTRMLRAQER
jgi:4-amino-4-deoxy-L-arabinose transferase-like glycosyltransferase